MQAIQGLNDMLSKMMTVDDNMVKAQGLQPLYGKQKKRLIEDGKKRFWTNQRVRLKPGT
jgi:hypothetical protein